MHSAIERSMSYTLKYTKSGEGSATRNKMDVHIVRSTVYAIISARHARNRRAPEQQVHGIQHMKWHKPPSPNSGVQRPPQRPLHFARHHQNGRDIPAAKTLTYIGANSSRHKAMLTS
mmetsp:Transcript_13566/g.24484  ORF Transcript_13566/g.24484 Transcript_13566/m.24484 type:complete len:117 (+) Transcript_13566:589-939(+)